MYEKSSRTVILLGVESKPMDIKHHSVGLKAKFGLAAVLTLLMLIAPLSSMLGGTGMEFIGNTNASNTMNSTNQTTPVPTNCAVSYTSQIQSPTSVQMNITGDYLIRAAPDYYLVDMVCSTTVGNTVFLLLTHQGVSLDQNLTVSNLTMGVNTTTGHNQIINYYWHDGVNVGAGHIVIVPLSNPIDTTPRISMWPGKVNQHNWNGTWLTDPDGVSGGHPSTLYSNDYGDRKVEYCQKWWPATNAVQLLPLRETITFYTAGNAVAYESTKDVYECLMSSGNSNNGSGNGSQGGTAPPVNPSPESIEINLFGYTSINQSAAQQVGIWASGTTIGSDFESSNLHYNDSYYMEWALLSGWSTTQTLSQGNASWTAYSNTSIEVVHFNLSDGNYMFQIYLYAGNGNYIGHDMSYMQVGNGYTSNNTGGGHNTGGGNNTGNGSQGGTTPPPSTNPSPPPAENETENEEQEGAVPPTNPTPPIDEWGNGSTSTQIEAQAGDSWSPEQQMVVVLISLMIISALIGLMWSLFSRDQL